MIEVKNLTKRYGSKVAVDDVSFTVDKGEILGFLGPNGAGKSTTMNILTGYLSASEGSLKIGEYDILENPIEAKRSIGYLPEQPPLYLDMTVQEYLDFIYDLKSVKLPRAAHIKEVCEIVKITEVSKRIIKNLSKGYRQRVGIAQALIGNPEVLILDEPTVGLDPKQIIEIRNLIKTLSSNHTVILSSHILPEIQAVCDRVIVISQGKLVADDTTANLSKNMSEDRYYTIQVDGPPLEVVKTLESIHGMVKVVMLGKREETVYEYTVEAEEDVDIRRELFKRLAERHWPLMGMRSSELTLEDIFLQLTRDTYSDKPVEDSSDVPSHTINVSPDGEVTVEPNSPDTDDDDTAADDETKSADERIGE